MKNYSIVETDNFGGDYPNESFIFRHISEDVANAMVNLMNEERGVNSSRFHKVVKDTHDTPYELQPGFQP